MKRYQLIALLLLLPIICLIGCDDNTVEKNEMLDDENQIKNLISIGDIESGSTTDWIVDSCSISYEEENGIDGSTALKVKSQESWSGVGLDVTNIIERTKSYYFECWIKLSLNNPEDIVGVIELEFRPSVVNNHGDQDWVGYSIVRFKPDASFEESEIVNGGVLLKDKEWVKIGGVIRSSDMETLKDQLGVVIAEPIAEIICFVKVEPGRGKLYRLDNLFITEIPNTDES